MSHNEQLPRNAWAFIFIVLCLMVCFQASGLPPFYWVIFIVIPFLSAYAFLHWYFKR